MFLVKKTTEEISDDDYEYYYLCEEFSKTIEAFEGGYDLTNSKGFYEDFENLKKLLQGFKTLVETAENKGKADREKARNIEVNSFDEYQQVDDLYYNALGYFSYRQFTYKSLFFLAFTIFENRLVDLSRAIDDFVNSHKKLPELNGWASEYKTYLETNLTGLNFATDYPDLKFYSEIRNAYHHRNGLFKCNSSYETWINKQNGITYKANDGINQIVIENSAFISDYINYAKCILSDLSNKARKLQPVKKP